MQTTKRTIGTRTYYTTTMTNLTSKNGFYSINNNSFSFRFVLDKILQLEKIPVTNPIVHKLSSSLFSYSLEIFHNNFVSIETGNNLFTDIVVNPNHKPLFSSAYFLKQSFGRTSAFDLEFGTQIFEFSLNLFDFRGLEEFTIRSDSKIINSEVDAKNFSLQIRTFNINIFREYKQEKTSSFFINSQQTFIDIPSKIFNITFRNIDVEFSSTFDCSDIQNIIFETCASREIISHRDPINYWLGFSFFDHSTSLFDTSNGQLTLQTNISEMPIDQRMKFDIISDLVFPSSIYAELQASFIDFNSLNYFRNCSDFDFGCCSDFHIANKEKQLFKPGVHICPVASGKL